VSYSCGKREASSFFTVTQYKRETTPKTGLSFPPSARVHGCLGAAVTSIYHLSQREVSVDGTEASLEKKTSSFFLPTQRYPWLWQN